MPVDTMPAWAVVIIAVVGAVGGLSGVAALYSALRTSGVEARKTEVEALVLIVNEMQEENARLRELVKCLQCTVDKLTITVRRYRDGIRQLLHQLEERGIEPVWRPDDDDIGA